MFKNKNPAIKTAKRDIKVFKGCYKEPENAARANFNWFIYKKDVPSAPVQLSPRSIGVKYEVNEGYHSHNHPRHDTNCVFVIPKGAQYIDGSTNCSIGSSRGTLLRT